MTSSPDKATLAIVGTPIGNLKDITYRGVETLAAAQVIFCEDTRTTRKLLQAHGITTKTKSYHAHSGDAGIRTIAELLTPGSLIALVSDAGMPTISDPGARVVDWVSTHMRDQVTVTVIPGPDAATTALAGSGSRAKGYRFYGFLPTKKGRQKALDEILGRGTEARIVYESTHRIVKLLTELEERAYGGRLTIARELTKMHEEFLHGTAPELCRVLTKDPQKQKGEFVVIFHPTKS